MSGGKVYTYFAGTTTPKATFTDASEGTQAANPIILDASGRAAIWIVGTYRIDVYTSADVLVRSTDNVPAFSSGGDMTKAVYDPANIAQQSVGLSAVQTLTNKTITNPNIIGTTTNDSAATGSVGEYVSSTVAAGTVSLTDTVAANVTSISLTAGDWDVWGTIIYTGNSSTTVSYAESTVNTTSATRSIATSNTLYAANVTYFSSVNGSGFTVVAPQQRISIASTTTVYLVAFSDFGVSTMAAGGFIGARRRR